MSSQTITRHGLANLKYPITQVSLAVRDLNETMTLYHQTFGWAPWQVFDHVPPVHHATALRGREVHYALRGAEVYVGSMNFELLQPLEGPNLWSEFIDAKGEGIASIATMFLERRDGDAVKQAFRDKLGIDVSMKAEIGDHIEYYYLDTQDRFGCLIESGSGHAIDFVKPALVYPSQSAKPGPSPLSGIHYPLSRLFLVVRDIDPILSAYRATFGWGPWQVGETVDETMMGGVVGRSEARVAETMVGDIAFEIIQPIAGRSPFSDYLQTCGEGLAGFSCELPGIAEVAAARRQFLEAGVGIFAEDAKGGEPTWVMMDSQETLKTLVMIADRSSMSTRVLGVVD